MTPSWFCASLMLIASATTPKPEIPPLPVPDGPSIPTAERFRLPNGLSVLLMPNHANPYVEARFVARAGTSVDPAGKEGLGQLTAGMLTNGTSRHDESQVADLIESMGATADGIITSFHYTMERDDPINNEFQTHKIIADAR